MEHRIRCLEHNIRKIMDYLHLDYDEQTCDLRLCPLQTCSPLSVVQPTTSIVQPTKLVGVQPTTSAGPVQFFSPNAAAALVELAKSRLSSTDRKKFVPVEDGFITTAGNKELGAKYGNTTGSNRISG